MTMIADHISKLKATADELGQVALYFNDYPQIPLRDMFGHSILLMSENARDDDETDPDNYVCIELYASYDCIYISVKLNDKYDVCQFSSLDQMKYMFDKLRGSFVDCENGSEVIDIIKAYCEAHPECNHQFSKDPTHFNYLVS